eukprot:CAMPEP_0184329014 /NCGR_PEP_ID=MMETSP1049-20130417/143925_1 /TAXON_ID=77928 /ORGANISM="Proteomonas sulcata, Strain CCMP704" /LENGTH=193 /DNA_ID=CAMNT_0026651355 /DNA_START=107 /DNA_END=688 /DNA_ORIENTATION=-
MFAETAAREKAEENKRLREKEDKLMKELTLAREEASRHKDAVKKIEAEEAARRVEEQQSANQKIRDGWKGVGMRIAEAAPFTVLYVQKLVQMDENPTDVCIGDVLCAINGVETKMLALTEVRSLILGPPGTTVTLTLQSWRTSQRYTTVVRRHWELAEDEELPSNRHPGLELDPLNALAAATDGLSRVFKPDH